MIWLCSRDVGAVKSHASRPYIWARFARNEAGFSKPLDIVCVFEPVEIIAVELTIVAVENKSSNYFCAVGWN